MVLILKNRKSVFCEQREIWLTAIISGRTYVHIKCFLCLLRDFLAALTILCSFKWKTTFHLIDSGVILTRTSKRNGRFHQFWNLNQLSILWVKIHLFASHHLRIGDLTQLKRVTDIGFWGFLFFFNVSSFTQKESIEIEEWWILVLYKHRNPLFPLNDKS